MKSANLTTLMEDLMAIADGVENDENIEELAFDYEW